MQASASTPTAAADQAKSENGAIRPFHVDIPEEALDDLGHRIAATRWTGKELVEDRSQGVQLATMRELMRYWATDHDWRKCESRLNALPQFKTEIDGLDVHFIHVRSPHEDALPLIITHGWPGSVIELLEVVGPLTDPTAHGGRAEDAFDLVLPSLPGYGFSEAPASVGWDAGQVAKAWAELMSRLGYTRYVAQGGDLGAAVSDTMALQASQGLVGIHLNFLRRPPLELAAAIFGGAPEPEGLTETERAAVEAFRAQFKKGYIAEQGQSPQTIGYALTDSPVGLAAWMLDHDADAYAKISRAFVDGVPSGGLTRDRILDNITLYWLTSSATAAARMYWESQRSAAAAAGQTPPEVSLPVAFTVFPGEIFQAPRSWAEKVYSNLIYFNGADRGGHFAAWEEPELFSAELRAAFSSLR
ncbi:MAG TPA: epoxide hydrolase [Solirubrobacteraceae bacterium]|jgi:pimeloyl-ACP methyl ester carboxylesterase|nr:epoxide hydrolase [Solirubrobacteraceae bacterium]